MGAYSGNLDLEDLLGSSYDEIIAFTADCLDIEVEELEDDTKYTLADLFAVLDGIIRVNFTERPGLIKNAQSLFQTLQALVPEEAKEEPTSSDNKNETTLPSE